MMKNNIEKLVNEKIESLIHIICEKYPRVKRDQLYLKVKQLHLYTPCGETSGRKSSLPQKKRFSILESIEEARSIIKVLKTPHSNHVVSSDTYSDLNNAKLVMNTHTKTIIGFESENGSVEPLNKEMVEICHKYKLFCELPLNLNQVSVGEFSYDIPELDLNYAKSDSEEENED